MTVPWNHWNIYSYIPRINLWLYLQQTFLLWHQLPGATANLQNCCRFSFVCYISMATEIQTDRQQSPSWNLHSSSTISLLFFSWDVLARVAVSWTKTPKKTMLGLIQISFLKYRHIPTLGTLYNLLFGC